MHPDVSTLGTAGGLAGARTRPVSTSPSASPEHDWSPLTQPQLGPWLWEFIRQGQIVNPEPVIGI